MATLLPEGKQSFTNSAGVPLVGGKLYTYDAGTSTPRTTYQDSAGTTPNTNPVILDARGEATVFWSGSYKVILKDSADVTIWTVDGISGSINLSDPLSVHGTLSVSNGGTSSTTPASARTALEITPNNIGASPRAARVDVASVAGVVDLTANAPNTDDIRITGTLGITGFTVGAGRVLRVVAGGAFTLTNGAGIVTQTGSNIVVAPGDTFSIRAVTTNAVEVLSYSSNAPTVASINRGQLGGTRNPIINGAFQVWQLGTSFTLGAHLQKNADRWNYDFNGTVGTATISRAAVPASVWTEDFYPTYCLRMAQTVAGVGNTFQDVSTQIEGVGVLAGKPVTISFWAISNSGGTPSLTAVKTEQYFGSGGAPSGPMFTTSAPVVLSATWAKYTVSATLASAAGKTLGTNADDTMNVIFTMPLNQVFDISITNVQIEAGVVATPYEFRSHAAVMADCQRYLVSSYDNGVAPGTVSSSGALAFTQGAVNNVKDIQLPAKMRTTPAVVLYNPATGATGTWNNAGAPVAAALNTGGMKNISISTTGGTAGAFMTGHFVAQDPLL